MGFIIKTKRKEEKMALGISGSVGGIKKTSKNAAKNKWIICLYKKVRR